MSFGDVTPKLSSAVPPNIPAISELQRLLKPLSANNHALRQTTTALLQPTMATSPPNLKRVRVLRDQNRLIARAATSSVSAMDSRLDGSSPAVFQRAMTVKKEFQVELNNFSDALQQSINAERRYLQSLRESQAAEQLQLSTENEVALREESSVKIADERQPLLPSNQQKPSYDEAAYREFKTNETIARETNSVLLEVQSSMHEINSLFKDLSVMITDQTSQVEYVEVAVADSALNVQRARRELEETKRRSERNKRLFFIILLSTAGVLAALLIILLN